MPALMEGKTIMDNSETPTRHGHCERAVCGTEGQLFLIEMDTFKADKKRGVAKGRRWYCADCQGQLFAYLLGSSTATLVATENLETGEVRIPVAGPTRAQ
jgi:hypothetical protein